MYYEKKGGGTEEVVRLQNKRETTDTAIMLVKGISKMSEKHFKRNLKTPIKLISSSENDIKSKYVEI